MKTCVLFWDFDGTLTRARSLWTDSVYRAICEVCPAAVVEFQSVKEEMSFGFPWHDHHEDHSHFSGERWWPHLFEKFRGMYDRLGIGTEDHARINASARSRVIAPDRYTVIEGMADALCACARLGCSQWILSNNYPELEEVIKALGLGGYFDGYVVSALVGYDKPHPEIFRIAREMSGDPSECWMIGDNPVADIQGAKRAGMHTIHVHGGPDGDAEYACEVLSEIPLLIAKG